MPRFLNKNNEKFARFSKTKYFVDKTVFLNKLLEKDDNEKFICNSRPRRFGKSVTADMLVAYFSKGAESKELFAPLKCVKDHAFLQNMNQYNTIFVDMQAQFTTAQKKKIPPNQYLEKNIVKELHIEYPSFISSEETLEESLSTIYYETGSQFVIIFDEWDYPIRELEEDSPDRAIYIDFLCGLFKNSDAKDYIRLAYLTGILPIIRAKGQSAVNNFHEYTMVKAKDFAPYIGFTEGETRSLCEKYQVDFQKVKEWYNGYSLNGTAIYNPLSVVEAVANNDFDQHWTETGTYSDIRELINMNMDGVLDSILLMLSGEKIPLNTHGCKNDMHTFANKDQVITTLVHLGYIAYDSQTQEAYIPNKEVQKVFEDYATYGYVAYGYAAYGYAAYGYPDRFTKFAGYAQEALISIEHEDAERVAEILQIMHNEFVSSIRYHDENSLCCVIMIAMLASLKTYHKAIREFPCGKGFADLVYLPLRKDTNKPAILMELKWNKSAKTAITQIKERQYPKSLEDYAGEILLVGIDYQKETKEHTCIIERYQKE
ncbi:MAG: AAA family ATPase [Lachnospiraceae bacterium]|nr:AAA family ATPase [Lachnospiraceae bacterium]